MSGVLMPKSRLFFQENALKAALYYCETGRVLPRDRAYDYKPKGLLNAVQFSDNPTGFWVKKGGIKPVGKDLRIHAKVYETEKHLIFSSQNSGSSPNLEFAIVYDKALPKVQKVARETLSLVKEWIASFKKDSKRRVKGLNSWAL